MMDGITTIFKKSRDLPFLVLEEEGEVGVAFSLTEE